MFNRRKAIAEIGLSLFAGLGDLVAPSKGRQDQPHNMAIIVLGVGEALGLRLRSGQGRRRGGRRRAGRW
ncbi:MAG: hypothetical protein ACLQED_13020 [Desulfobaccales bacterium]